MSPRGCAGLAFGRREHLPNRPAHIGFDGSAEQRLRAQLPVESFEGGGDVLQRQCDSAALASTVELLGDRGLHRPASLVSEDNEQRHAQVHASVLKCLSHGGESCLSSDETGVAFLEVVERLLRRVDGFKGGRHGSRPPSGACGFSIHLTFVLAGKQESPTTNVASCALAQERCCVGGRRRT